MAPLLRLQSGSLAFGHVALLDDAEFAVEPKERVCLIGRNGTGKSTLLNVLHGDQTLDGGQLWRRDGVRVAKLAQEVPAGDTATLFETVAAGLGDHSGMLARLHTAGIALESGSEAALTAYATAQAEVDHANAWDSSQRVDAVLSRLNLPADARLSECSGGLRRRAMLGQAIVAEPEVLLLDEPTNHLDIDSIAALEEAILNYVGAVVFITHDRAFIDRLATRIVELDRGILRSYPGSYADYQRRKEQQLAAEADAERKFDTNLAAEEVWIRQGIKARRTRNEGRVRRLEALRREQADRRSRSGKANLRLDSSDTSGKLVIEAKDVSFGYSASEPLISDFSTLILRGDRIGIIGPNGSGKSTLLKLLLGDLEPSQGSIKRGSKLQVAYFDQERQQLDPERSVRDNVADGTDRVEIGGKSRHVVGYLGDFLFPPARVTSPVKTLSGGERNRLLLAKLFTQPANLLVLDEPTNDLDIETLELLEELLENYAGTLLLVSHDRSFIDRTVTSTLVLTPTGRIEEHVGGYSDWLRYHNQQQAQKTKLTRTKSTAKVVSKAAVPAPATDERRLSYNERRELAQLPERIETLETQQLQLQTQAADPTFYQQSQAVIDVALQTLADVDQELQQAYERWEALEG